MTLDTTVSCMLIFFSLFLPFVNSFINFIHFINFLFRNQDVIPLFMKTCPSAS